MHNPEEKKVVSKLRYYQTKLSDKKREEEILREEAVVLTGPDDQSIITFHRDPMPLVF